MSEVDDIRRRLAVSIVDFLRQELANPALTPEDNDNLQIAVEALENSYELGHFYEIQRRPLLDMFQQVYNPVPIADRLRSEALKAEGNSKMANEQYEEAERDYTCAIELDRFNPIFYCNRAGARIKLQKFLEATSDCRQALILNPDYAKAYGRMGQAYASMNRHRRAARCFRKALELEPDNETYRNNLRAAEERVAEDPASVMGNLINGILSSTFGVPASGRMEPERTNGSSTADNETSANNLGATEQRSTDDGVSMMGAVLSGILSSVMASTGSESGTMRGFIMVSNPHIEEENESNNSLDTSSNENSSETKNNSDSENSSGTDDSNSSENGAMHMRILLGIPMSQGTAGPIPCENNSNISVQTNNNVKVAQNVNESTIEKPKPEEQCFIPNASETQKTETEKENKSSIDDVMKFSDNSNSDNSKDSITFNDTPVNQSSTPQQSKDQQSENSNSCKSSENDEKFSLQANNDQRKPQIESQNLDSKGTSLKKKISKFYKSFGKSTSDSETDKNKDTKNDSQNGQDKTNDSKLVKNKEEK